MSWHPITGLPIQLSASADGTSAVNYYLKFYQAGTSTAISMATDSSGGTTLAKAQFNSTGYCINGSSAPFIPHLDRNYKAVLYATSADADANTNAVWTVDNVILDGASNGTKNFSTMAAAKADTTLAAGDVIQVKDRASALFDVGSGVSGANGYNVVANDAGTLKFTLRRYFSVHVDMCGADYTGATDSAGAISAAASISEGTLMFGPGTYRADSTIKLGNGNARVWKGAGRYVTTLYTNLDDLVDVGQTNDAGFFHISEMKLESQSGGGHIFVSAQGTSMFKISECKLEQDNAAKSIWYQVAGYNGGGIVENCHLVHMATASTHAWYINSTEIVNGWTFRDLRCDYSYGTTQFFYIGSQNASSFITNMTFRDITFELTYGGMIKVLGARLTLIDNCAAYDLAGTQTGHGIYVGTSAGGRVSSRTKISRCGRYPSSGALDTGICDIKLESGAAANTIIEQCMNSAAGNTFTVDYGNNKCLHIDRPSNSESSYSNADNVTYIDINGDFEGIVAPAYHTTTGTSSRELTIATGVIVPTKLYHTVDTEANAASDDLDTITATYIKTGDVLYLRPDNTARTVVVKHGTGNIYLTGSVDFTMDSNRDLIALLYTGTEFVQVNGNNGT